MKAYERLLKYVTYATASDESCLCCPSTSRQLDFARALADEMNIIGVSNTRVDSNGYVYGKIPANITGEPSIGFIAHMDVSPDAPSENIRTIITPNYDGGIIKRPFGDLDPQNMTELKRYVGKTIICSDGSTLLGADDKAGISEIMTLCEYFLSHPEIKHGDICIAFTPDEEIGRGADLFNVSDFGADFAYTADGAAFGEVEYETFNAASAIVTVTGVGIHPGEAYGRMINAASTAARFELAIPDSERPHTTRGRDGFYHLVDLSGSVESARLVYIIRDHDAVRFEERKHHIRSLAESLNSEYGRKVFEIQITEQYRNMAEIVTKHPEILDRASSAVLSCGGTPVSNPVRGGTDGSRLSFMGLPCPNLGTGSHGHHGRNEFAVAEEMDLCVSSMIRIVTSN